MRRWRLAGCAILALALGVAGAADAPTPPVAAPSGGLAILDGSPRWLVVLGASGSTGYPLRLQRKFYRLFGKAGADCPVRVISATAGMKLFPHFAMPTAEGGIERKPFYASVVQPALRERNRPPAIVIGMDTTGGFIKDYNHPITGPEDAAGLAWATSVIRACAKACLEDGAAQVLFSNYYYEGDGAKAKQHRYEGLCMQRLEQELPGFRFTPDIGEAFIAAGKAAWAGPDKADSHPNQYGDEVLASGAFRALLKHDGREIPAWDAEEVEFMKQVPAAERNRIKGGQLPLDKDGNGWLAPAECADAPFATPWKPEGAITPWPALPWAGKRPPKRTDDEGKEIP